MPSLTGAFLDIAVVENLDDEEEEEEITVGQTTEDIEIERDSEEAEWQEHNDGTLNRLELATALDMTFNMIVTSDRENLQNAGMLSEDGTVRRNTVHDAVRVVIYEDPDDDEPNTIIEATDTQFKLETVELPIDDIGVVEVMAWVNGDIRFRDPGDTVEYGESAT